MSIESSETGDSSQSSASTLLLLNDIEARILGALIEKEATTPEAYPLTANAVVLACNQKNNREPVMELEPGEVGHCLRELEGKGLIRSVHGARAQRYEHRFAQAYSVTVRQQAVLSVMLLRGPQTIAELFNRCERLTAFADADEVRQTLDRLEQRKPALAVRIGRAPGQREDRYMHLLCGELDEVALMQAAKPAPVAHRVDLEARVAALETELQALRLELEQMRQRMP